MVEDALRFLDRIHANLERPQYEEVLILLSAFRRDRNRATLNRILYILEPWEELCHEFLQFVDPPLRANPKVANADDYGPSYERIQNTASTSGVLNQELVCRPRGKGEEKRTMNAYDKRLFECEDRQYEIDMKMELVKEGMKRIQSPGKTVDLGDIQDRLRFMSGRVSNFRFIPSQEPDIFESSDLGDVYSRLRNMMDELGEKKRKADFEFLKAHDRVLNSELYNDKVEKALLEEIRNGHQTTVTCITDTVHEDLDALLRSGLRNRTACIWSFFTSRILQLPIRSDEDYKGYFLSDGAEFNGQRPIVPYRETPERETSLVFYGTHMFYVLLKLYVLAYERTALARRNCRDERVYAGFLRSIQGTVQGKIQAANDDQLAWARIVKQLDKIERDMKSMDAVSLYCQEMERWKGNIDTRYYYVNATLLNEEIYKFDSKLRGSQVEVGVQIMKEDVVKPYYRKGKWVADWVRAAGDNPKGYPVFRRKNIRSTQNARGRVYIRNGLEIRKTLGYPKRPVTGTEDVFRRCRGFKRKARKRPCLEDVLN